MSNAEDPIVRAEVRTIGSQRILEQGNAQCAFLVHPSMSQEKLEEYRDGLTFRLRAPRLYRRLRYEKFEENVYRSLRDSHHSESGDSFDWFLQLMIFSFLWITASLSTGFFLTNANVGLSEEAIIACSFVGTSILLSIVWFFSLGLPRLIGHFSDAPPHP